MEPVSTYLNMIPHQAVSSSLMPWAPDQKDQSPWLQLDFNAPYQECIQRLLKTKICVKWIDYTHPSTDYNPPPNLMNLKLWL